MAHFHAVLDYPDEDIDDFKLQNYLATLNNTGLVLSGLMASYERGRVLREGVQTAIIGKPNAGKSSLLNALLGYERAIVTHIAGTTRDTIEEKILIGNVLLRLIDTAGLRETDEIVEKLGVERTHSAIQNAGFVLLVVDCSEDIKKEEFNILKSISSNAPIIIIINKIDIEDKMSDSSRTIDKYMEQMNTCRKNTKLHSHCIRLSALTGEGLDSLETEINKLFPEPNTTYIGELITNTRQYEAISRSKSSIDEAIKAIEASLTPDVILIEVEAALNAIGEVTGKIMRDDIVSRIFQRFCVGK
jgi:tRNA modification GTPase